MIPLCVHVQSVLCSWLCVCVCVCVCVCERVITHPQQPAHVELCALVVINSIPCFEHVHWLVLSVHHKSIPDFQCVALTDIERSGCRMCGDGKLYFNNYIIYHCVHTLCTCTFITLLCVWYCICLQAERDRHRVSQCCECVVCDVLLSTCWYGALCRGRLSHMFII